jgi:hypothetical protein
VKIQSSTGNPGVAEQATHISVKLARARHSDAVHRPSVTT